MAKIMLVEDDTNLSEIYQARLTAEGYDIVSAHDGEEALALAAKEKPDLVISDVMMPKISGFEMLDILRNTEGLKETKVIMLTALGQADDKSRAESMGADRYLVKSQVTLEDIVKAAQELLGGDTSTPTAAATSAPAEPAATPTPTPVAPAPTPTSVAVAAPPEPQQSVANVPVAAPPQAQVAPVAAPAPVPTPVAPAPSVPVTPVAAAPTPVTVPVAAVPAPQAPAPAPTVVSAPAPAVPVAPATPATPAPQAAAPAPAPAAPINTAAAADDQLVTNAVEDLEKAVQPAPAPAPAPDSPATSNEPPTPPASPDPEPDTTANNNGGVAHKKVIKPIDSPDPPKPSLETLLANEERKNPGSTMDNPVAAGSPQAPTPTPPVPHQPGHIISPNGAAGDGVDPNSIAL